MQRAALTVGNPVDRRREKLDDGVVETVRRKFGAIDPGFVRLLAAYRLVTKDCAVHIGVGRDRRGVRRSGVAACSAFIATSAANLKFLSMLQQIRHRNFKFKAATQISELLELL
jgi:hypothetical protein